MIEEFKENQKIRVNFEYNDNIVSLLYEPYKTKMKLKKGLHCSYLNRNLYKKENENQEIFFQKKEK